MTPHLSIHPPDLLTPLAAEGQRPGLREQTILLAEDESIMRDALAYQLRAEGYQVVAVADGPDVIKEVRQNPPDLVLLDLMLLGLDGFDICKQLRAYPATCGIPIMLVTARDDEYEKIIGLELGADDYITKPFSWLELRARIRAHLRRSTRAANDQQHDLTKQGILQVEPLRIDLDRRQAWCRGQPIELTARLFDLLVYFVCHRGIVLTRNRLLEQVWGYEYPGDTQTVNVYVRWLREKIEEHPATPQLILTVRGVGYRFKG